LIVGSAWYIMELAYRQSRLGCVKRLRDGKLPAVRKTFEVCDTQAAFRCRGSGRFHGKARAKCGVPKRTDFLFSPGSWPMC
jgi:hypothetical protein